MPSELAGKQTWIDTNMCDDLKTVEDGYTDMLSNDVFENICSELDIDLKTKKKKYLKMTMSILNPQK